MQQPAQPVPSIDARENSEEKMKISLKIMQSSNPSPQQLKIDNISLKHRMKPKGQRKVGGSKAIRDLSGGNVYDVR